MNLFFTADAKINPEHSVLFNQIAVDIRESFIDFIDSLSRQNAKNIDWWISSPASRNTFVSPLFHYCCCIALLQELIQANENFTEIITDSRAFKKILEDYLAGQGVNARVRLVRLPVKQCLIEFIRPLHTIFGLPLRHVLLFFVAKRTLSLRKPLPLEPLVLIDTFVMPDYIEKDRFYPSILDSLSKKERESVWYVPHLYGFRLWQFLQVVKRLRKSERNFLLKDDFLKFQDYWCLWGHFWRVRKLQIKASFFCGMDISPLVREELESFRNISSSYLPLLNYCFAKRLKQSGIELRLIIDWFENQAIDRGWNIAFRYYFPKAETIGYQGFIVSPHYLCIFPSKGEKENRIIPHKVAVIGRKLTQSVSRFCSDLNVCIAPAFRFQHVWQNRKYFPAADECIVLVALPIMIKEAVYILKLLAQAVNEKTYSTRFWIKPHPTSLQTQIQGTFGAGWPEQFEFVDGDFNDCIEKSHLLISNASSACLETLAKGVAVIVVGNNFGLTHNPIPETITEDIWSLCYTHEEIMDAIKFYKNRSPEKIKEHEEVGKRIRQEYFEPVTREGVREFLGF